jgi:hypothetical protein
MIRHLRAFWAVLTLLYWATQQHPIDHSERW